MKIKSLAAMTAFLALGSMGWAADLARVNGKAISDQDLKNALGALNEGQRQSILKDPNSRRQVLLGLVDQELLVQEAERTKLDQDREFRAALQTFRKQYLANKILEKNLASKMTDAAARKYFEAHKSQFGSDQVYVQHILLADEASARQAMQQAQAKDADFMALAEKLSKDPSAKNNRGDIGFIGRDSPFVKEFKDAAFQAKEGELVGPIKTLYGYHVIKVVKKKFGKAPEYDEVELRVKDEMRQELVQTFVGRLKTQSKVQIDDKALETIQ